MDMLKHLIKRRVFRMKPNRLHAEDSFFTRRYVIGPDEPLQTL